MKQLDLFAGIGGISLAAEWAGIETVAFCEKEPFAQNTLHRQFPGRPIYDDVFNLTQEVLERDGVTGIDIVAGGFPCQPFSHAGKRTGTADDRYLWPQMCRVVEEVRPTWVLAENVDGLVSMAQSSWELIMEDETAICTEAEMVLETIREDLEAIGYQCIPVIIPACGIGASHRRYRICILGYTERSGCSRESWGGARQEPSDGHLKLEEEALAHTKIAGNKRICSTVGKEARETRKQNDGPISQCCGQTLVNTSSPRLSEPKRFGSREEDVTRSQRRSLLGCRETSGGSAQSGVGRSPYELSDWLDGWGMNPLDALINFITSFPQPALMGQEQHAWEPPRVAIGVKNRAARLKALGNAVDPLQFLPVLYGIRVIHEFLLE